MRLDGRQAGRLRRRPAGRPRARAGRGRQLGAATRPGRRPRASPIPLRGRGARDRRAVVRAGSDQQDPRRPRHLGVETGRAARGRQEASAARRVARSSRASKRPGERRGSAGRRPEALAHLESHRPTGRRLPTARERSRPGARGGRRGCRSGRIRISAAARRCAVASLPTMTAAASRRSCARRRWPNRLASRPLERIGQLPRGEIEQGDDDRQARRDRQRPAARPRGRRPRPRRRAPPARPRRRPRHAGGTGRRSSRPTAAAGWAAAGGGPTTSRCSYGRSGRRGPTRAGTRTTRRRAASASNAPSNPSR